MRWIILGALLTAVSGPVLAQTFPERPGPREFVLDEAGLVDASDRSAVRDMCDALLSERKIPIVVVTIRALGDHGARDVEAYARALFDHWGIGSRERNRGVLLLVARRDRRARIELGAGWAGTANRQCEAVMEALMSSFRRGDYSQGLRVAVSQLADMARGRTPKRVSGSGGSGRGAIPWFTIVIFVGIVCVAIYAGSRRTRPSARRRRRRTGGSTRTRIGRLSARRRFDHYWATQGSGGIGMGAFGGGSGGGGGATGSW
jgi:uncharacterized protein